MPSLSDQGRRARTAGANAPSRSVLIKASAVSTLSSMKERFLSRGPDGFLSGSVAPRRGVGFVGGRGEAVSAGRGRDGRAVKAGRRPPVGGALRARSVIARDHWLSEAGYRLRWVRLAGGWVRWRVAVRSPVELLGSGRSRGSRAPVIYPPRQGGMEGFGRSQTGSIKWATTPPGAGVMTSIELASGCAGRVSPRLGQAADVAVAQAVVDEGEKFAGGGDPADGSAAPVGDSMVSTATGVAPRWRPTASTAAQRTSREPCLVM